VINKERDTKIGEAHRWKLLAEDLQKRYSLDILHGGGEGGS
jgi:hypothetical protein